MIQLNYNITQTITNINEDIIEKIDEIEKWTGGVSFFGEFLDRCEFDSKNIESTFSLDKRELIYILASIKTSYLIRFLKILAEHDYQEFKNLINSINFHSQDIPLALQVTERILLLYRITIFPDLFSKEKIMLLCNTVNNI